MFPVVLNQTKLKKSSLSTWDVNGWKSTDAKQRMDLNGYVSHLMRHPDGRRVAVDAVGDDAEVNVLNISSACAAPACTATKEDTVCKATD